MKPTHYTYSGWLRRVVGLSEDAVFSMHEDWDKMYRIEYQKWLKDNGFAELQAKNDKGMYADW